MRDTDVAPEMRSTFVRQGEPRNVFRLCLCINRLAVVSVFAFIACLIANRYDISKIPASDKI